MTEEVKQEEQGAQEAVGAAEASGEAAASVDAAAPAAGGVEAAAPAAGGDQAAKAASPKKPASKKGQKIALAIAGVCVVAAVGVGVFYAVSSMQSEPADPALQTEDVSGGVAAAVGDVEIGENAITSYIEQFREGAQLTSNEAWGEYLEDAGETPETYRDSVLTAYIHRELVRQAAASEGVSVNSSDVDAKVSSDRQAFDSDEEWEQSLKDSGMTKAAYRANAEATLLQQALADKVIGDVSATDAEVLDYITTYTIDYKNAKSLAFIPSDVVERYRAICDNSKSSQAFSSWLANYQKSVNVTRNAMPSGLSYDIDMEVYEQSVQPAPILTVK